jgi:hypothetical protein
LLALILPALLLYLLASYLNWSWDITQYFGSIKNRCIALLYYILLIILPICYVLIEKPYDK